MVPWAHLSQPPKRHLDWFSRFCTAHPYDQHTDRQTDTQTDTQTKLRVTSAAIGHIYECMKCGIKSTQKFTKNNPNTDEMALICRLLETLVVGNSQHALLQAHYHTVGFVTMASRGE